MDISKIQLAAALVAALGITAPAFADDTASTDKTAKSASKVQLDDAAPKKEKKKGKSEKSCKKGEKSCKKGEKSCKKGEKSCKAADKAADDKKGDAK